MKNDLSESVLDYQFNKNNMIKYSFTKGLWKTLVATSIFAIPLIIDLLPTDWLNMSIGSLLFLILNWAKVSVKQHEQNY
jgi:hypothetical protein